MPLISRRETKVDAVLSCPHDGAELQKLQVEGVTIDRCGTCGGTWFDALELRRVAKDKELEKLASRLPMVRVASPFLCPRCGSECLEGHVAEVEVDTCVKCEGIWLDKGELAEAKRQLDVRRMVSEQGSGFRDFLVKL